MIHKGEPWGAATSLTGTEPVARSDAELSRLVTSHVDRIPVLLRGGDLFHSLGGQPSPDPFLLPIDVLEVRVDGVLHTAVAHVVARRRWWSGPFGVAMNGTHLGPWNLGPKAHPNDGLVDTTTGELSFSDRLAARRRAPLGTHVPHPALTTHRGPVASWTFDRPTAIRIDGVEVGAGRSVEIRVVPDRGSIILA